MFSKIRNCVNNHFGKSEILIRKARKFPRYTPVNITFGDLKLHVVDLLSVSYQLKEYFTDEEFVLPFPKERKLKIYDLGANMGIATLYFKKKYPNAEIVAYEADPDIFYYLKDNIRRNLTDAEQKSITLKNKAVWVHDGEITFNVEGADAGSIISERSSGKSLPAIDFRKVLEGETNIDFLKVDIEGAEFAVIAAMRHELKKVKSVFIEAHFNKGEKNNLDSLLRALMENGFKYYLKNAYPVDRPFVNGFRDNFSYQLSIFAVQDNLDTSFFDEKK